MSICKWVDEGGGRAGVKDKRIKDKRIGGVRVGVWLDQKKNWWVWVVEPNLVGEGVEAS